MSKATIHFGLGVNDQGTGESITLRACNALFDAGHRTDATDMFGAAQAHSFCLNKVLRLLRDFSVVVVGGRRTGEVNPMDTLRARLA